eukprot:1493774-Amphidinium_carterae.2
MATMRGSFVTAASEASRNAATSAMIEVPCSQLISVQAQLSLMVNIAGICPCKGWYLQRMWSNAELQTIVSCLVVGVSLIPSLLRRTLRNSSCEASDASRISSVPRT